MIIENRVKESNKIRIMRNMKDQDATEDELEIQELK
jgi:hypothetical protein